MTPRTETLRELDHRTGDGIDVQLLWDPQTNRVSVGVADERTGEVLLFEVDARDALDAFHHPYAYAMGHGGRLSALAADATFLIDEGR
jgi:hypothetical protein